MKGLFGILPNNYEVGANWLTDRPVLFLDPAKIDAVKLKELKNRIDDSDPATKRAYEKFAANQLRSQIEAQSPGILADFSDQTLAEWAEESLKSGPAARRLDSAGVCIVSEGFDSDFGKANTVREMTGLSLDHFKNIPGSDADWDFISGRHESRHCSDLTEIDGPGDALNKEVVADRGGVDQDKVSPDVKQAWTDMRTIAAITRVDTVHATGFFIDDPEKEKVTQADYDHVVETRKRVYDILSEKTGITSDVQDLFSIDPHGCNQIIREALDSGKFSKTYPVSLAEQSRMVLAEFKRLDISPADLDQEDYDNARKEILLDLGKQGKLERTQSPEVEKYVRQYLEASDRRLIPAAELADPAAKVSAIETKTEIVAEVAKPDAKSADAVAEAEQAKPGSAPYEPLAKYESVTFKDVKTPDDKPSAPAADKKADKAAEAEQEPAKSGAAPYEPLEKYESVIVKDSKAPDYDPIALYAEVTKPQIQQPAYQPAPSAPAPA